MAKSGDKRRLAENSSHLKKLQILIAIANVLYVVFRFFIKGSALLSWHGAALALTSSLYLFCYSSIAAALAPHYSSSGELVYSGADLKMGGVLSYYHDVIYVSLCCQMVGAFTSYAWLLMLSIPAYALWAFFTKAVLPGWNTPKEIPESEMEKKRREKKERQTARAEKFQQRRKA